MKRVAAIAVLCCAVLTSCSDSSGTDDELGAPFGRSTTPNTPAPNTPTPNTPTGGGQSTTSSSIQGSTGSSTARRPSDIDPCSLVTKSEADGIAGVRTRAPVRALGLCTFATPTSGAVGQLEVLVGDGVKKYYDIDKTNLGHEFRDIAGLADEAHLEDGVIFVRAGAVWFALRVTRLDSVDTGPALTKLARVVLGRL